MNKEITCRLVDGNPVVEYKEEYVPKKGDIVKIFINNRTILAVSDLYKNYQASILISRNGEFTIQELRFGKFSNTNFEYQIPATPEEAEVMRHILNENGYEIVNGEVVKKRWIPKMHKEYWYIYGDKTGMYPLYAIRHCEDDELYISCFKTEKACQAACDKLNELALTLAQE